MATVADIVTGILVTELAADDDVIMNWVTNQRQLILKHFLFRRNQNRRKLIHQVGRLLAGKKKVGLTPQQQHHQQLLRRRRAAAGNSGGAADGESNRDHDYIDVPRFCPDEFTEFRNHFNIQRETFDKIVKMLLPKFGNLDKSSLPIERKVLVAMWLLSSQESFRSIGDKFGLQKSTTYYAFVQFINAVHSLASNYIFWPDADSMAVISGEFERQFNFPGVVGVVNACQIPVKISPVDDNNEARAEPYSTVSLQAVCDPRMKFMDIHIGAPQPAHAITCAWKFFEGSPLGKSLGSNEWEILPNMYLMGDTSYPLRTYLLTPYKEEQGAELSAEKKKFNAAHKTVCKVIHKAFGLLRSKFARLKYVDTSRYELIPQMVTTACVLHNFIMEEEEEAGAALHSSGGDPQQQGGGAGASTTAEDHDYDDEHVHPCPQADHHVDDDAVLKRDVIAKKLC